MRHLAPASLVSLLGLSLALACSDGTSPTDAVRPTFRAGGRTGFGFNGEVSGFPTGAVRLTGGGSFEKLTGVVVRLSLSSARPAVDGTVATTVFRMLQETLTNVARHAAATRVEIALEVREEGITLRVADNGRGISAAQRTDPHSLGLVGLRERAIACAGEVVIEGRPGVGTIVTVRIPLPLAAVVL
jgi:signal transduction histidine kinase